MTRAALVLVALSTAGCPGPLDPVIPPGDDDDTVGDDDDDFVVPESDVGSLNLIQTLPALGNATGDTLFGGLFVDEGDDILNLAQCVAAADAFCARELPANPGESVLVQDYDPALLGTFETREVGSTVVLGPWIANYAYDSSADLGFYFQTWDAVTPATGILGVQFDGGDGWGGEDVSDLLPPPTAMKVLSHDPMQQLEFFDVDPVALRWEPAAIGDVYLLVTSSVERRLYRLDDNGAFDLDLSGYALADAAQVDLVLGRWTQAELDVDEHELGVMVQSNQPLHGVWRNIGQRDDLTGDFYDTCAEAVAAPGVPEGYYFGDFTAFADHIDPGPGGCTGFAASGADAFVPVDVLPHVELTATFSLEDDDASLYLLGDCSDVGSCLAGSDGTGQETVVWLNDSEIPRRVYLVLDAFDAVTSPFRLDLTLVPQGGDILVNTCAEAITQGPVASGNYGGILSDHLNLLEPYCAMYPVGGEGMVEVFLPAGSSLNADVQAPGATLTTYLLSNCAIADSCFQVSGGSIAYTNATPFGQTFYLVVDSPVGVAEYFLDIEIQ